MLLRLQRRLQGEREGGFTLIELMVVVLIIAILIAIAIPTFLGARQRAQNRATQSSLRNSLTAAKTMYTDNQTYAGADSSATGLITVEPSLTYAAAGTASSGANNVSVGITAPNTWAGAARTADGARCFFIRDVVGTGTVFGTIPVVANCNGTTALTAAASSW
jgi:type IV pilus assembly protein PilA